MKLMMMIGLILGLMGCDRTNEASLIQLDVYEPVHSYQLEEKPVVLNDVDCDTLDFSPLYEVLETYGHLVSIYFENFKNGCVFSHNEEINYFAASTFKAPFALWLYALADDGIVDMNELLEFNEANYFPGSGIIRTNYTFGQSFRVGRLIALMLYESDNVATQMLRQRFGYHGYADFIASLGGNRNYVADLWNARLTAAEAGFFMREIYRYIEGENSHSSEFLLNLLNNQFPFITSTYQVASKTGWYPRFGGAWHDMAIIWSSSPFSLSILSSEFKDSKNDHYMYEQITYAFERFNRINFTLNN